MTGVKAAAANLRWAFSTAASMAVIEMKNRYGKVRRSIVTACSYDSPPCTANPGAHSHTKIGANITPTSDTRATTAPSVPMTRPSRSPNSSLSSPASMRSE